MTVTDTPAPDVDSSPVDIGSLLNEFSRVARESDSPVLLAAGTFAIYPMPDGGMMLVMKVDEGPMAADEPHRARVPAALLRAMGALAGGSKTGALKALMGRGK